MSKSQIQGQSLVPGMVVGKLHIATLGFLEETVNSNRQPPRPEEEMVRFEKGVIKLLDDVERRVENLEARSLSNEADILKVHSAILQDDSFKRRVYKHIHEMEALAEEAIDIILEEQAVRLEQSNDPVFRERAADFRDMSRQLRSKLAADQIAEKRFSTLMKDSILAVDQLFPSTILLGWECNVKGFIVTQGTSLSHAVIIARSLGIPIIRVGSLQSLERWEEKIIQLDADTGIIFLEPADIDNITTQTATIKSTWRSKKLPIQLSLSIMMPDQLIDQNWEGINGIGMYRTEMIYLRQLDRFPSEEEQVAIYQKLFAYCEDQTITIRTADLGADKPISHMHFGPEKNPYLGLRAHRLFYYHPEILITQIRSIVKASNGRTFRLLFPMLETFDQWNFIASLVNKAVESLRSENTIIPDTIEKGILIETPAAVWEFPKIISKADFVGVGTNDLVQYIFAVERDAPNVARFYQSEHPVILRILHYLVESAHDLNKPISICGELASDKNFIPLLIGLGFDQLTIPASQIDVIGSIVATQVQDKCYQLINDCMTMNEAEEVRCRLGVEVDASFKTGDNHEHAIDPICGMIIDKEEDTLSLILNDIRYYFCSQHCLEEYRATYS